MTVLKHNALPWDDQYRAAPLSGLTTGHTGLPTQHFGRETTSDLASLESREWLITNGIGGYAGGSLAGSNTRGYHGLLVAAVTPPVGRMVMLAGMIETLSIGGRDFPLTTLRWHDGTVAPNGSVWLEAVMFEGTMPTWRFAGPGFAIEKTVMMDHAANITRIEYRVLRANEPVTLRLEPLTTYRDYHSRSFAGDTLPKVTGRAGRLKVAGPDGKKSDLYMAFDGAKCRAEPEYYRDFDLAQERNRGLTDFEDRLRAGSFTRALVPGEVVQFVASAGAAAEPDAAARTKILSRESQILSHFHEADLFNAKAKSKGARTWHGVGGKVPAKAAKTPDVPAWAARLALAADQFIVRRTLSDGSPGHSVIAGYHWFADWGRDTMISLPGLTHMCGRPDIAESVLRAFANVVDGGMIPNRFTDDGGAPEYNTVDATFWFIEAIATHWRVTGDDAFLTEMFPLLTGIVEALQAGTRYGIGIAEDGLITAGEAGVQLTWMDAKVGDWVVTPRIGKPIEVNALWLSALAFLIEAAPTAGAKPAPFKKLHKAAKAAFEKFWNPETGYAFDVIDGPGGNDASLRPNQIFAARASVGAFDAARRRAILDACENALLTPAGLRSLNAEHPDYKPHYGGDQLARDSAYHQGTVWTWLIGAFIEVHLDLHQSPDRAAGILAPYADQLGLGCIGTLNEIFEADAPHAPRGCVAQAWSVAEVLRAWRLIAAKRAGT